ncbi:MAG: metallophosphoesterase [Clostridiales bacterium]|nr:metallophosphoesterase [Clostridiales bacterium]
MTASLFHHPQYQALLSFIRQAKGPLLLHISDTHTDSYSFARDLISAVQPALILHTGDMADEWKAGRLPEHVEDYKMRVLKILDILKDAGVETWIVPGNNDLPDYLSLHCDFPILEPGTFKTWHGISMRLSHQAISDEKEAVFAIYGHVFSADPNHPSENPKNGVVYLNGVFEWTVIDSADGSYFQISLKERKPK